MRTVSIDEMQKIPAKERILIDIRDTDRFAHGTLEGAVNLPLPSEWEIAAFAQTMDRETPVFVLGNTSRHGEEAAAGFEKLGFTAAAIAGGYAAAARMRQEKISAGGGLEERTAAIERSLIKKFRKVLWSRFTRAVRDYKLISPGDKIAVCISGGKDSMLLAKLMQEIQRHGIMPFELEFLCMNPGYNPVNWDIIENNARILSIPLTVFESRIFDTVAAIDKNPCYLCARMRRGYLYSRAKELGCNKIALGHHYDDVIETILMGMLYAGKIETMMPKLHSQHVEGMELIRPLYLIREKDVKAWRDSFHSVRLQIHRKCRGLLQCAAFQASGHERADRPV